MEMESFISGCGIGTTGARETVKQREKEGNPPWKYEPRISITKSFVFVATQVNDNPTPCESNVNPSLCIYALLSRFIIRQI